MASSTECTKTLFCVFHFHNATASQGISVQLNGQHLRREPNPVFLGVTLNQTLSYHLKKSAAKISTLNNLLRLLAGSSRGASATTPKTSVLALCYSTVEYCAPVWAILSHTKLIDHWWPSEWIHAHCLCNSAPNTFSVVAIPQPHHSPSCTSGEWQQQTNFSVRSGPQPSLCLWYQTSSPILKSASHQDTRRPVWLEKSQQEDVSPRQK